MRIGIGAGAALLLLFGAFEGDAQSVLDRSGASPYAALNAAASGSLDQSSGFVGEAWGEVPLENGAVKNAARASQQIDAAAAGKTTR